MFKHVKRLLERFTASNVRQFFIIYGCVRAANSLIIAEPAARTSEALN